MYSTLAADGSALFDEFAKYKYVGDGSGGTSDKIRGEEFEKTVLKEGKSNIAKFMNKRISAISMQQ